MKLNKKAMTIAFFMTLSIYAIGWAITVDAIWQNVYIAATQSLRVTPTP